MSSTAEEKESSRDDDLLRFSEREVDSVIPSSVIDPRMATLVAEQRPTRPHHSGCAPVVHVFVHNELGCPIELERLACSTRNTEYNPSGLPGAIMRLVDPKSVALVFDSGKMVVMGTASEATLKLAARKIAKIIMKVGFPVRFQRFQIVNMLATCDTRFPIRIEGIHFKHALCSYYEPEIFPGLVYRMRRPKVTMMIFVSGKVVLVGARMYGHLATAFEKIYPSLLEFRKTDAVESSVDDAGDQQDLHSLDDTSLHHLLLQTHPVDSSTDPSL